MESWPEILTLDQAAKMLQVSRRTVQRLLKDGSLPARQVGGQWRFDREQLRDWVRSGTTREATAQTQHELIEAEARRLGVDMPETLIEYQRALLRRHGADAPGDPDTD